MSPFGTGINEIPMLESLKSPIQLKVLMKMLNPIQLFGDIFARIKRGMRPRDDDVMIVFFWFKESCL